MLSPYIKRVYVYESYIRIMEIDKQLRLEYPGILS